MSNRDHFWDTPLILSPSLICLDPCNLESQVRLLESAGIETLHIDLIDGHFSPSLPLGLETVKALRKKTRLRFDAHVMAENNGFFIRELLDTGVDQLIFHIETEKHPDAALAGIKNSGVRAGVALKPSTSLTVLDYIIEKCDTVMLMLINPGYAGTRGEKQVPYAERKVRDLRRLITERKLPVKIELDGRISRENIGHYGRELADIFVVGSTCISQDRMEADLGQLRELCAGMAAEKP
ncbi:MAG: ribulose-phosphate 3-epimerase [Spirochaetaceae bacterium]|jgi:ribulose-phosphate 3-epimerase|nr:ribulose-phosphate 3-epimerase [Spirochaetaceae bacterium]